MATASFSLRLLSSAASVALAAGASPLAAQSADAPREQGADDVGLETQVSAGGNVIVVTAQRREEAQVDVPISITALGTDQLEAANVEQLSDIVKLTPALRFDRQSQFVQPTIRGIGTSITTSGGGSNVGIYVDGFYSPNPAEADFELFKVRSVQVLKGPQGTLFGRNSTGGAILVDTADPSTETSAAWRASYGSFDTVRAQTYATTGITDHIAFDIEGLYTSGNAFQRNLATGRRDRNFENWQIRAGLKADFGAFSAKLRYQHLQSDDPRPVLYNIYTDPDIGVGTSPFYPPSAYTTDPDFYAPGADRSFITSNTDVVQLTLEADLGFADLTSYTQYRHQDLDSSLDLDKTALPIFQFGIPVINNTWTQELLLTSKAGARLQYTAGLFFLYNSDRYLTFLDSAVSQGGPRIRLGGSEAPTRSYAAFVDATYELTDRLFLTGGVRYAHDTITDASFSVGTARTFVPDTEGDKLTPRIVVRYKPSDQTSIYASFSRGYKAAIVDVGGSCQNPPAFQCNAVEPEEVDAFELGFKGSFGAVSLEAAGFYYDYSNLQVSLLTNGRAEILNAAKAEIYGVEGALSADLGSGFSLNAAASYVHGRYTDFPGAPVYFACADLGATVQQTCQQNGLSLLPLRLDLTDVDMQRTPEFTGNIGGRFETTAAGGSLIVSGNLYYTSQFSFAPSGTQFPGGDYETLSVRAEWRDPTDRFYIAAFGDNLTDNRFVTQVQYNNFGLGATYAEPATWGLELGFAY